jgi:hypothetical protein
VEFLAVTAVAALRDGIRQTLRQPSMIVVAWVVSVVAVLPLAAAVGAAIGGQLDASGMAERAAAGADYDWLDEFGAEFPGLGVRPAIIGFAAVVANISNFFDRISHPAFLAPLLFFLALWTFVSGGIIDRIGRVSQESDTRFSTACGSHFFRLVRIGLMQSIVFAAMFGVLYSWLFDNVFSRLTENVDVERTAFFVRVGLYLVFALALALSQILFDYAKVRLVVEGRRSAVGAVRAAARLLVRQAARAIPLYALNVALLGGVIALYAVVAPGSHSTGWSMWAGFLVAQLYIAARLWARLVFWSSDAALFRSAIQGPAPASRE